MTEKNHLLRVDQLWAAVSVDEDGNEGLCAFHTGQGWMPLVAADPARLADINRMAATIAIQSSMKITIIKFTVREDVDFWDGRQ